MKKLASLMAAFTSIAMTAMDERSPSYRKKVNAVPSNPNQVIPNGANQYHFNKDGYHKTYKCELTVFTCVAINKKSAKSKFEKWKVNNP